MVKSNVLVLVWLRTTKIWRKSEVMLRGYRHLYSLNKIRRHLLQHSKHQRTLVTNSWSFIQNIDNWRFWIWKKQMHYLIYKITKQALINFIYMLMIHVKQKYQFLINKREGEDSQHCNDFKAFIKHSNDMMTLMEILNNIIQIKKCKIMTVFDDMITVMLSNKKT